MHGDDEVLGSKLATNLSPGGGFALADVNGDAFLDLVLGDKETGTLSYYPWVVEAYEERTGPDNPFDGIQLEGMNTRPALGDLDSDADLDLIVCGTKTTVYEPICQHYRKEGDEFVLDDAPFAGDEFLLEVDDPYPALGDVDGDARLDMLLGAWSGALVLYPNGYCTQEEAACSSRGLCGKEQLYTDASCDCLGGYTGFQCGECQAGFYGSTCELCPQGGDEARNAPRLTDTCGVKGSGRSRGSCDDGVHGDGTCECFGVFSGSGCTEGTCPAGTVETATPDGYFTNAACKPCVAGTFSAEGDEQCTKCAAGKSSACLLYTSPSPRDKRQSRMPSSA